jgi:hypothetical protein
VKILTPKEGEVMEGQEDKDKVRKEKKRTEKGR